MKTVLLLTLRIIYFLQKGKKKQIKQIKIQKILFLLLAFSFKLKIYIFFQVVKKIYILKLTIKFLKQVLNLVLG